MCSNDLEAGVAINSMNCRIPESLRAPISGNCHLWGSDGSCEQMLFIYLLRIGSTPENVTLHYFYGSQMYSSRHQLCAANNNFEMVKKVITENCMQNSPEILPNMDSLCCSDINVSINFNEGNMEVHFLHGFIEIPVDYLDCTSKSYNTS